MKSSQKDKQTPRPPRNYSEAFKRQVVAEFESGLYTKATLKRKYGIAGNSCLPRWLRKYGNLSHPKYHSKGRPMKDKSLQKIKELEAELLKRTRELELSLKKKEAELTAYKKLVEVAERELDIKIVKKSGAKQSKS
jgi:transposase-like protein